MLDLSLVDLVWTQVLLKNPIWNGSEMRNHGRREYEIEPVAEVRSSPAECRLDGSTDSPTQPRIQPWFGERPAALRTLYASLYDSEAPAFLC